ncbi:MAG: polysaccharide biosynthesis protein [Melioribacteraceae bacterium]
MFSNKTVLITGGTGSFGSVVAKRLLTNNVKEVRIFSRDEKKQEDMRISVNDARLKFYIGDVRDYGSVDSAMIGVNYVFNAAALKQVPSCEFFPMEAIKTNVIGADNVMSSAIKNNVERVVILSTDKSVYPINAMGMTKAISEKVMVSKAMKQRAGETVLCATRYGNVMASRGSVIPLFVSQLKNNEELTVTDPDMTRFLMSLDDSIDLVFYALINGGQGDIFVQKSPASTVGVLAQALKEMFAKDNNIKIIGTRHGEKLFESLISREEMVRAVDHGDYYCINPDNRDLNYNKYFDSGNTNIDKIQDYTSHNTTRLSIEETKELLFSLDYIKEELNA